MSKMKVQLHIVGGFQNFNIFRFVMIKSWLGREYQQNVKPEINTDAGHSQYADKIPRFIEKGTANQRSYSKVSTSQSWPWEGSEMAEAPPDLNSTLVVETEIRAQNGFPVRCLADHFS